ncbi:MAG: hypothetical protein IJ434_03150 [Alistipes sp.]|nr:hypothetical protein [Alistipes sp.]
MKRLFLMIVAIAWVGLSTCPAYAEETKTEASKTEQSQKNEVADSLKTPKEPKADNVGSAQGVASVAAEKQSREVTTKETMIATIVLVSLALVVSLLLFWLVCRKLNHQLSKVYDEMNEMKDNLKDKVRAIEELQTRISSCEKKVEAVKSELGALKNDLSRLISEMQAQPVAEEIAAPSGYQVKTWYGMYESSRNGFSVKYITTDKETTSQFIIYQTSETSAEFAIIETISNDLFSGAKEACEVLDGDPMNFIKISVERKGQLMLEGNTWKVTEPVQIRLY